ncbi:SgcJ/EcaC family oxidoreductase [Microbispora sp. CA-102843]|uniref:SgcJ/EcaC family oxidoreductase n=1 Tax=Microbispora sp. CA-102843 TaxID=3239952 RepID=UPI003D9142D0
MTDDHERIRDLIERWAEAVHRGDIDGVVADHADDIVMFDVPPPYEGVRGLDDYRETWPPFFAWQAQGACFEIESLDVTAGEDVAFAHALLRCGSPEELAANPRTRLRLTLGLRRQDGRWVVAHEHHSFPYAEPDAGSGAAEEEVRELHRRWFAGTAAKDLDGLMAGIAGDVVSYEHDEPLQHRGAEAVREV